MSAVVATTKHEEHVAIVDKFTVPPFLLGLTAGVVNVNAAWLLIGYVAVQAAEKGLFHRPRQRAASAANEIGDALAALGGYGLGEWVRVHRAHWLHDLASYVVGEP